jgi:RHS repeat-associated protein
MLSPSSDPCVLFPLAAFDDLAENSRQGFTRKNVALHQGGAWSNSGTALGIEPVLRLEGVRSRCQGKERDTETGNDDFGARYYSNRFGRWLSADWSAVPVAIPYANPTNPQTLNLYSMVADDPESFADLDGHDCLLCGYSLGDVAKGFVSGLKWALGSNSEDDSISGTVASGSNTRSSVLGWGAGVLVTLLNPDDDAASAGSKALSSVDKMAVDVEKTGGRLGSAETRALDKEVAKDLEAEGYTITHGAGKPQEYIPGPGGSRKGSSYPDITATKEGKTLRVNTVDTNKSGTLTKREARNAKRIQNARPNDEFRTVPKKQPQPNCPLCAQTP